MSQALVRADTKALLSVGQAVLHASEDTGLEDVAGRTRFLQSLWTFLTAAVQRGMQVSRFNIVRGLWLCNMFYPT